MKKIAILFLTLMTIGACSTYRKSDSAPMKRLAQADISLTVINPDTLTDYEARFEEGKAVDSSITRGVRPDVLGFIGDFDRFRIKFLEVKKTDSLSYSVSGQWSWYGDEGFVKDFKGTIHLDSIEILPPLWDFEKEYDEFFHRTEYGMIYATAKFYDDQGNVWMGKAAYEYDVIAGQYHYCTLWSDSDGYGNNAYEGKMLTKEGEKVCNWVDFRIPESGNHDSGCGMFVPQGGRGWDDYVMVSEDSILRERDRNWMNFYGTHWQEMDWKYEKVLELCYMKLVAGLALTKEDYLALMPQSRGQFWQFWDCMAHQNEEGKGRGYYLDEAVTERMMKGDFEIMGKFMPACWKWADGGVAEETWEVQYELWKKYPKEIEKIAEKEGRLDALKGEIEMRMEYDE